VGLRRTVAQIFIFDCVRISPNSRLYLITLQERSEPRYLPHHSWECNLTYPLLESKPASNYSHSRTKGRLQCGRWHHLRTLGGLDVHAPTATPSQGMTAPDQGMAEPLLPLHSVPACNNRESFHPHARSTRQMFSPCPAHPLRLTMPAALHR
jgi:hypothetical protein